MVESRHQCLIYHGPPTINLRRVVPVLVKNLVDNYRCLFLGSPTVVARIRYELELVGLEVSKETQKGALILSSDQSHLVNGEFDVQQMLKMLENAVDQALKDGYRGLWASGDMTWEFGMESNLQKLLEYEYGLEQVFQKKPALHGICQYHRDTLPKYVLSDALATHPSIFLSHTLQRVNPYYVPPELLNSASSGGATPLDIDRMLQEVLRPEQS